MSTVEQDLIDPEYTAADEVDQTLPPESSGDDLGDEAAAQAEEILRKKLAHLEEIEALRNQVRQAEKAERSAKASQTAAKKRREEIQERLDQLIDLGWEGAANALPLDGDAKVNGSASTPAPAHRTGQQLRLDMAISCVGMDADLYAAVETVKQDYPIETLGDLELFLDKQPTEKRSAYLTAGHESALRTLIEAAKASEQLEPATEDDSWRTVSIDVLSEGEKGVSEALLACLRKKEIETIGDLADWTSSGKQLADIDGIGKAKAERIEDAMEAFWASRKGA